MCVSKKKKNIKCTDKLQLISKKHIKVNYITYIIKNQTVQFQKIQFTIV